MPACPHQPGSHLPVPASQRLVRFFFLLLLPVLGTSCRNPPASSVAELKAAIRKDITPQGLEIQARAIVRYQRPSGSPGENAAIDHIVSTLSDEGLQVDVHTIRAYASDPVSARVEVVGRKFSPQAITLSFSAPAEGLEAPLVDMGRTSDLPDLEKGTGELLRLVPGRAAAADPAGAIALAEGRPSNLATAKLALLGAVGVIFVNPQQRLNDLIVTTTWGTPSLLNSHRLPRIPVAEIKKEDGQRLRSFLSSRPVRVRLSTEVKTGWKPLRLAVVRIPGPAPDSPFVLFGGHIDAWYYGGTDEGASNAAMVELARALHRQRERLRRGLVVAWWLGHSNARYAGSTWFADQFFDQLRSRAVAYLNIDGIGQTGARRFSAATTASLADLARQIVEPVAGEEIRVRRPGRNSDQSFNGIGLPLLQINHSRLSEDGGYWWWHTPQDTLDKIDFGVLETDAELYGEALANLLASPNLPLDLVAEMGALGDAIRSRLESAGGQAPYLEEAIRRQQSLLELVAQVEANLPQQGDPEVDLSRLRILRPIHRVLYVPQNPYHPDSGAEGGILPGLAPAAVLSAQAASEDRLGFAQASLRREYNRLLEALDQSYQEASRLRQRLNSR